MHSEVEARKTHVALAYIFYTKYDNNPILTVLDNLYLSHVPIQLESARLSNGHSIGEVCSCEDVPLNRVVNVLARSFELSVLQEMPLEFIIASFQVSQPEPAEIKLVIGALDHNDHLIS